MNGQKDSGNNRELKSIPGKIKVYHNQTTENQK